MAPAAGGIDLLEKLDVPANTLAGTWDRENDGSVTCMETGALSKLQIPGPFPPEYDLRMVVERRTHPTLFVVGVVAGEHSGMLVFDWMRNFQLVSGLETIDGVDLAAGNGTERRRPSLETGERRPSRDLLHSLADALLPEGSQG